MLKNIKKIDEIHIEARRWFQKTFGNTYHTVKVEVLANGEWIDLISDMAYGYGDHYMHTAANLLLENGFSVTQMRGFHDLNCDQHIDKQSYQVAHDLRGCPDVTRVVLDGLKRDLHKK